MKVVYPDLVFGAIASSAVTYATIDDWQYYDIIRQFADPDCVKQIEITIEEVDDLLSNPATAQTIKGLFGLHNVTHIQDFASLLSVSAEVCTAIQHLKLLLLLGISWCLAGQKLGSRSK